MKDRYADLPNEIKQAHFDRLIKYREELRIHPVLKSLFIEMTLNCNEHCRHCGSKCGDNELKQSLTDEEILTCMIRLKNRLIDEKKRLPFISVTGGEPLLRPGMIELMKKIYALGFHWGMTSNGLLITEEVANELKASGLYSISISLDGLEKSHDWFRQRKGSYERTIQAVQYLLDAGVSNVMITTVVHKRNISELDDIRKVVQNTGCHTWRIVNVDPIGRALGNDEILLDKEELKYMIHYIADNQSEAPESLDIIFSCNHYLGIEYERVLRPWYFICQAGIGVASIQYNGDISACLDIERRPELSFGNIREKDLYDTWINEFKPFRVDKTKDSSTCKNCEARDNCQGSGFHTWDIDLNEPRICMKKIIE